MSIVQRYRPRRHNPFPLGLPAKSSLTRWLWLATFVLFFVFVFFLAIEAAGADLEREALRGPRITPKASESSVPSPDGKGSENADSDQPVAHNAPISGAKGFQAHVGAFSDVECGSNWCDRHEPKDGQIALNYAKFGRHSKVYIPAFDKTYRVVGATYCGENCAPYDAEIWFGPDQAAAFEFGERKLLINLLP